MTRVRLIRIKGQRGTLDAPLVSFSPALLVVVVVLMCVTAYGQDASSKSMAGSPVGSDSSQRESPQTLSLRDAIDGALKNNLSTLLAKERKAEARGLRTESRAALLPNVSAVVSQTSRTLNLAALGFTVPGFPTFIGPFNVFDARVSFAQSIFNLTAIRQYQVGKAGVTVAALQEHLAREQVASSAALAYLNAVRTERRVQTAGANLELAKALATLALNQKQAGIATGVDVTRALTRQSQEEVNVAQAQTEANQALLQLLRVAGLSLASKPTLTDSLRFTPESVPTAATAVSTAVTARPEVLVAQEELKVADLEASAARAERLPSVDFISNYGSSGITPSNTDFPTREVGVRVTIPIFNGGATNGRVQVATSRQRQAALQLKDVEQQVEQDVRDALQTLATSATQVKAADEAVSLAERELQMARDRFSAGVGDNIEVINAQTALANARDSQVTALTQHNAARINVASALGRAEDFKW